MQKEIHGNLYDKNPLYRGCKLVPFRHQKGAIELVMPENLAAEKIINNIHRMVSRKFYNRHNQRRPVDVAFVVTKGTPGFVQFVVGATLMKLRDMRMVGRFGYFNDKKKPVLVSSIALPA